MPAYREEAALAAEATHVLDIAAQWLTQFGYRLTELSAMRLTAEHPGLLSRSTGQALVVASPIVLLASSGRLILEADFQGIAKLRRFIVRLLLGLAASLGLILGITFSLVIEEAWATYLAIGLGAGIPLMQLPVHLFLTLRLIRRRATRDLDTLLQNLAILATTQGSSE